MPLSAGEADPIVVRYSLANEVCLIFLGVLIALPGVRQLPSLAHSKPGDFGSGAGEAIAAWLTQALGPAPVVMLDLGLIIWTGGLGIAALWRLAERAPALLADHAGIVFHRSLHHGLVRWSDIEHIGISDEHFPGLRIKLRRRFWSLTYPATARTVEIKLVAANLTPGAAHDIVTRFDQLRK